MQPDTPQSPPGQPGQQSSLPPMSMGQPQSQASPAGSAVPLGPHNTPIAPDRTAAHYASQARQLATQYANDPFRLSEALGQLKAAYLSEQYHITSKQAGN